MTIRAILFDLDGTLVDSNDLHADVWVQVFADTGHEVGRDAIRNQIGKGGDLLVPALVPDLPEKEAAVISAAHGKMFKDRYLDEVKPFPRARDLLARVHGAGVKIALASSASKKELDHYVKLLGVVSLVDATTTIDEVETSKPAPDIVAVALKKLGVSSEEALFIGDTPYDIESAGKAGIATVAVLSGGFPREALVGAKAIYDDAAALAADWPAWAER